MFLDTSVLLRVVIRSASKTSKLLIIPDIRIMTSVHAVEEALRNIATRDQRQRLSDTLALVEVRDDDVAPLPEWIILAEKDRPILQGAIAAAATHLLTDDRQHFGRYFWQIVEGITILPSSVYLKSKGL